MKKLLLVFVLWSIYSTVYSQAWTAGASLGWVDVTAFGAKGDSSTDNTTSIQNAANAVRTLGGILYFPPGIYLVSGQINCPNLTHILGCGGVSPQEILSSAYITRGFKNISKIVTTSGSTNVFNMPSPGCIVEGIAIQCVATTKTAGSLLYLGGSSDKILNCSFLGGWIGVTDTVAVEYEIFNSFFNDQTKYGLYHSSRINGDDGDQNVTDCWFYAMDSSTRSFIRIESGGGIKIKGTKFNATGGHAGRGVNCIDIYDSLSANGSSDAIILQNSFENYTGSGISISAVSGGAMSNVQIIGNQISPFNVGANGILCSGNVFVSTISDNDIDNQAVAGAYAVACNNAPYIFVGNYIHGFTSGSQGISFFAATGVDLNYAVGRTNSMEIVNNVTGSYSEIGNMNLATSGLSRIALYDGSYSNYVALNFYGTSFPGNTSGNGFLSSTSSLIMGGTAANGYTSLTGGGFLQSAYNILCDSSGTYLGRNAQTLSHKTLFIKDNTATTGHTFVQIQGGASSTQITTDTILSVNSGGLLESIVGTGKHSFGKYGVGTFTAGTATYSLAVDASGNVMEVALSSFSNPMTSQQDMIYGGTSGAPTRLVAPGHAGMHLVSGASVPVWADSTISPSLLFTAVGATQAVNTTSETSVVGTGPGTNVLAANAFYAGKTIRIRIGGVYSTTTVPGNLTLKIKLNSVVIGTSTISTLATSASSLSFSGVIDIVCWTTGSSGTVISDGTVSLSTGNVLAANLVDLNNAGATTTINTTIGQTIDFTAQWATASTSNSFKATVLTIEALN